MYKLTYFFVCSIDSRWDGNPKLEMLKAFLILVKSKFLLMVVFSMTFDLPLEIDGYLMEPISLSFIRLVLS